MPPSVKLIKPAAYIDSLRRIIYKVVISSTPSLFFLNRCRRFVFAFLYDVLNNRPKIVKMLKFASSDTTLSVLALITLA